VRGFAWELFVLSWLAGSKTPFMLDSLTACGLKESRHPRRRMKSQLPLCYVKVHMASISPSNMMNRATHGDAVPPHERDIKKGGTWFVPSPGLFDILSRQLGWPISIFGRGDMSAEPAPPVGVSTVGGIFGRSFDYWHMSGAQLWWCRSCVRSSIAQGSLTYYPVP
jgi:hypothetical protein